MSNDNFKWTDELVLKFAKFTYVDSPTFQGRYQDLEDFKASNTSSKEEVGWEIVFQNINIKLMIKK